MSEKKDSLFRRLSSIDCSNHIDTIDNKGFKLSYLSWVWAWQTIKSIDPDAKREFREWDEIGQDGQSTGRKVPYLLTPSNGCMIECTVTIEGHSETDTLYVMDHRNKSVGNPDMGQINTTKQRCFVKACALQGLGLYIYAGEDVPTPAEDPTPKKVSATQAKVLDGVFEVIAELSGKSKQEMISWSFEHSSIKEVPLEDLYGSEYGTLLKCASELKAKAESKKKERKLEKAAAK
ncbi:DUF1071 domain-containing protein [Loigolactobacillus bifermentans]|jgi:hypothetical protein|uniref:Phage protein n=1 Tax=Loigolactobacillus bifermentans DSM 20003 TaxID=1423726 RepID=A0A0R1H9V7_9LACO|nr:DUF1071 domain-containing protein [Loigolactobacillus bifermentans]KRK40836.1 phage protein [Loigolactobacillus bifermentans DSM 20003]QGG59589.1 DUF1071 domain-containing protein [Loigolactobacillus bifermentans]